ncbi:hypothetical protein D5F01_LYC23880 [Larimichthys crocea]|uniref:ribonuclease H n=1 Tax=Larimichthys crocea TaxID=215358 RepID=A0A6G0HGF0_LARCR|nr:hypothetical protein D5F01_LYC23880 [Larimichthys crocea]
MGSSGQVVGRLLMISLDTSSSERGYVWQRLPQGYKNSPNVFQAAVMDVLKDLGVTIYIDDVFLADNTEEEHLQRLQQVVERLTDAGLKLNLKKCQFGQFRVNYLGFQVAADLGLSDGYREKLNQVRPPASENDLQKILGLCNYVRDHVPNYQKYAKPLYACLKKKGEESVEETPKKWSWTATDQQNLGHLKAVIQDPIRLEPRSLTTRLVAEVSCKDDDAVVKVKNEGGGGGNGNLVELHLIISGEEVPARRKGVGSPGKILGHNERSGPRARNQGYHPEPSSSVPKERDN